MGCVILFFFYWSNNFVQAANMFFDSIFFGERWTCTNNGSSTNYEDYVSNMGDIFLFDSKIAKTIFRYILLKFKIAFSRIVLEVGRIRYILL